MNRAVVLAAIVCVSTSVSLHGQEPPPPTVAPAVAQPAPASVPRHETHDPVQAQAQAGAAREYPSLRISGFGDVNFSATHRDEGPRGFTLGQLALHMIAELSPRVTFFGELSFTARADAGTGTPPATGFNTEVERMIIRFDRNDQLKVSLGRYHTPINWWNTAYHHGQWLQTSIARPEMTQFGGRFLPVHFVGALLEGGVPAGGWNLNYKAGIGNGRGQVISRAGDAGDINGNRAWLANLYSKPDAAYGLEFGGSVYGDTVTLQDSREFDEHIVSGHVVWNKEDPEVIAEFAGVRHVEAGSATVNWSRAFYVQVAYRLPWRDRLMKPYVRFEHIGIAGEDAMFATVPELDGWTAGLRYDLSQFAAIKGEFRTWTRGADTLRNYGGFFQACFTF